MFKIILSASLLLLRLPFLLFLIIFGLITIAFYPKDIRFFKKQHFSIMMVWMRCLSIVLGLKTKIVGQVDTTADLYVSNHVTYLDIIILNKMLPVNFIAKEEISKWPIIGSLASKTGTLFIKRGDNIASTKMIDEMQSRFKLKNKIIFFPEGKIGNGEKIKKFHSKLFKSIERKDMTIQPIAIRYPKNYPENNNYSEEISKKSEKGEMIRLYFDFLMRTESHVILHFLNKVNTRDYNALTITNVLADNINEKLGDLNS
jgi:1-acyl-sn-glycerol-3-phosphate acyltransferase